MNEDDQTKSSQADAEFQHKPVENLQSEAYCAVFPRTDEPNKVSGFGDSSIKSPLDPAVLRLALSKDARRKDARMQDGPRPSDFGDHEPIPEDAVMMIPVTNEEGKPE